MPWSNGSVAAACKASDDALWSEQVFLFLGDAFTRRVEETRRQLGGVDVQVAHLARRGLLRDELPGVRHGAVDQVPLDDLVRSRALAACGGDGIARHDDAERGLDADQARQTLGTAGTGRMPSLTSGRPTLADATATR